MEDEVVRVKVCDLDENVVFEGDVSTDVEPQELLHLGCFLDLRVNIIRNKATDEALTSLRGLQNVELIVSRGGNLVEFSGVLYVGSDGVVRKSKAVPSCECVMVTVWRLRNEECGKVFKCENLEELEMNYCELRQIPSDVGKMKNLKKLVLYGLEQLKIIPVEIRELSSLKELWIWGCGIESLPKRFEGLRQLEKLTFGWLKELKSIPEEIGELSSLKEMWLERCEIESLPKSIGEMKQLEKMGLMFLEDLRSIPQEVEDLSCLEELCIVNCGIESLPKSIGELKQLEKLILMSLMKLENIPEEIGQLSSLMELRIWSCSIECLPKSLRELKSLKYMYLHWLTNLQLHPDDVVVFSKLQKLCISSCDKLFTSGPNWNPLEEFCDMLKVAVNLRSFDLDWTLQQEKREILVAALQENGSIVEGKGNIEFENIFKRNKENRERARATVVYILVMKRTRRALTSVPKDMVEMIAKMLWITRCDVEAWRK